MIAVLIIDANPRSRRVMAKYLAEGGEVTVSQAQSVEESLELLKAGRCDVLVADMGLQKAVGLSLLDVLTEQDIDVPVIFYGYGISSRMITEAIRRGAEFVLPLSDAPEVQFLELRSLIEKIVYRRQAEVALQRTAEDLRTIVTRNADATLVLDRSGYIQYANPAAESLFNLSGPDLIGKLFGFPIILEEPVEIYVLREFRKFVAVEMRMVEIQWQGKPSYLISMRDITWHIQHEEELTLSRDRLQAEVQDRSRDLAEAYESLRVEVTERKQAELALRESERKYRNIVELANEGIVVIDKKAIIRFANPRIAEMLGHSVEDLHGKSLYTFVSQDKILEQKRILERRRQGIRESYDLELVRKDGGKVLVLVNSAPFFTDEGFYAGSVSMYTDITERKKSEAQLVDAKAQAELYLDLMGHDIRNLAQIALGYIELAIESRDFREIKELLGKPRESLEDTARIIDNVRKLQTTGKVKEDVVPVNICSILAGLKDRYCSTNGRRISISLTAVPDCMAMANDLVTDVFANLITNSIKHSDPGSTLKISLGVERIREKGTDYLRITVEDNGPGISDWVKDKIFMRFQRGPTKAHGKGLGLYIAKTLIDSYGGKMWIEDRVSGDYTKGARFVIVLYAAKGEKLLRKTQVP